MLNTKWTPELRDKLANIFFRLAHIPEEKRIKEIGAFTKLVCEMTLLKMTFDKKVWFDYLNKLNNWRIKRGFAELTKYFPYVFDNSGYKEPSNMVDYDLLPDDEPMIDIEPENYIETLTKPVDKNMYTEMQEDDIDLPPEELDIDLPPE